MDRSTLVHEPVMVGEMLAALAPKDSGLYVDGTFGGGGYTRAILDAADCSVVALDRDPNAIACARKIGAECLSRMAVIEGLFGDLARLLDERNIASVDGVVLDIGMSSLQLDDVARGFSFQHDGPLDMRMSGTGPCAAMVLNTLDESVLADILSAYGEERHARRIAQAIVEARAKAPLSRTSELANLIARVTPRVASQVKRGVNPATRTFLALRIFVNDELRELASALGAAEQCLRAGGRLVVVSFHSLEDRIVKRFLEKRSAGRISTSRHLPDVPSPPPSFRLLFRGVKKPSSEEVSVNVRARSARLRAAERTDACSYPLDFLSLSLPMVECSLTGGR
ncbi:MAG: 16S rRNA (cytosine(1402)-N(4))-methyltransferase RsmH [Parvularculales bacterium]